MEKKWALVTGASSGIGLAYAEELASRGYQLVIVSNEEQAIREKGEFLSEKYGIEVLPLYRDLAIPGAAKELYDTCQEKNIPIEVLVNNAGMFFFCETLQAKANIVEKMLYLHVTTPTQLCYYFGQEMESRYLRCRKNSCRSSSVVRSLSAVFSLPTASRFSSGRSNERMTS